MQFHPQAGHEQFGHSPAVVLSPSTYNGKTSLMLCCPLTMQIKGYPFEVTVTGIPESVALADQIKSLDWIARKARFKGKVSSTELAEIRAKVTALLGN